MVLYIFSMQQMPSWKYISFHKEKKFCSILYIENGKNNKTKIFEISGEFETFNRAYHTCLLVKDVYYPL
jgi:hypothetical protein